MQNYEAELDFETRHLAVILAVAQEQLAAIRQENGQQEAEILAAKQEQWENSRHGIGNLWNSDSFYELATVSQYEAQAANKISAWEIAANKQLALEKMVKNPYFSRIDFRFAGENQAEQVYIGRSPLLDESKLFFHIYDWRSPIASVFYRFGLGEAYYDAPKGRINGQVELKRQYEVRGGELEYFFDADIQIMDEFLKKLLAQNASPQMKSIVETIQQDQDIIIRDMENDLLLVQGVAGSGKTSVALHRVAYLMYQGLTDKLSRHNIMIISPNSLFERYISHVLPELGEKNVATITFDNLLAGLLGSKQAQSKNQLLEGLLRAGDSPDASLRQQALEFKASPMFKQILERFIEDIPCSLLEFSEVVYDGHIIAEPDELRQRATAASEEPLQIRLRRIEASIWAKVHELRPARLSKLHEIAMEQEGHNFELAEYSRMLAIEEADALRQQIHGFSRLDAFALYKQLFNDWPYFQHLAQGLQLPSQMEEIFELTHANLQEEQLNYEDGLVLAFLTLRLKGFKLARHIKQVVIDEAQDYYALHFELLRLLFPEARYTILGDAQQTIGKPADTGLFAGIPKIFGTEKYTLASMNKSFRCTREIFNFSNRFLPTGCVVESFSRQGPEPQIYSAASQAELDSLLISEIHQCQQAGYQSIGLLCKTEQHATEVYNRIKGQVDAHLITNNSVTDISGLFIVPIYMAKGLEFDAVLLCDTDKAHYAANGDKNLLYIGCTRALHRLNLFYSGEISPLLQGEGGFESGCL